MDPTRQTLWGPAAQATAESDADTGPRRCSAITTGAPVRHVGLEAGVGADGFEAWRELLASVLVIDLPDPLALDRFHARFRAFHFGEFAIASVAADAQTIERTATEVALGGSDGFVLYLCLEGHGEVEAGRRVFDLHPGDAWICDLSRTWKTHTKPFSDIAVALPRARLAPLVDDVDALHGRRLDGRSPMVSLLGSHLCDLVARAPLLPAAEIDAVSALVVDLVAGAIAERPTQEDRSRLLRALIKDDIERHLGDPDLGPDLLLRRHGLSRSRLYRLFAPVGGVGDYIRERRLGHALSDLAAARPDERLGDIALRWGFTSGGAFERAFRQHYRTSVRALRDQVRLTAPARTGGDLPPTEIGRWLRDLGGREPR